MRGHDLLGFFLSLYLLVQAKNKTIILKTFKTQFDCLESELNKETTAENRVEKDQLELEL